MVRKRRNRAKQAPTTLRSFPTAPAALSSPSVLMPAPSTSSFNSQSSGVGSVASDDSLSVTSSFNESPYTIMRLSNISSRYPLKDILRKIAPYASNIVGIARCADYASKRLGLSVYLISVSTFDGVLLENTFIDYREDGRDPQAMDTVNYLVGRARLMNSSYITRYERIPVTVVVKGLKRVKNTENQTYFLADLIEFFESKGSITIARLNYDNHGKHTKNTGFITFLAQSSAKAVANDMTPTLHIMYRQPITTIISDGVPLLVREEHSYLLHAGITAWTNEVEEANVLIFRHRAPFRHPHTGDPDEHATVQPSTSAIVTTPKRHRTSRLERERSSSVDSITCVHDLRGGTVPFDFKRSDETETHAQEEVTSSTEQSNGETSQPTIETNDVTSTVEESQSIIETNDVSNTVEETIIVPSKRQKVDVHDIICMPPNTIPVVTMPDGQVLIISEFIDLDDDSE